MTQALARRYDLAIVGMGSAGMVSAEFAATLGLRVAVIERDRVGGDCLWTGCVPSKALLASAKAAHTIRHASRYGLPAVDPDVDTALVWQRIRSIQAEVAATDDNPDRYREMGVEIVFGAARLTGPHSIVVTGSGGEAELGARFVLLCTGSRPAVPEIPGLAEAGFLTSENVFQLERAPASIAMIGGGPIATELAQAFTRLGTRVSVLQKGPRLLPRDDPDLVAVLTKRLLDEGVDVRVDVDTQRAGLEDGRKVVHGTQSGRPQSWTAEEVLVAAGRRPNLGGLGLSEVGVRVGTRGVEVDERMRTSVPSIYAVGDVAGRYLFTHSAAYEGVRAIRDMFFPGKGTAGALVPWCTFTDPELAHAGLTVDEARQRYGGDVEVWRFELSHSDRARADSAREGAVIVVTAKRARVVGAHVLAPAAGEMIHELALAIERKLSLNQIASLVHVYPTLSTSIGQLAAEAAFRGARRLRWLVRKGRGSR